MSESDVSSPTALVPFLGYGVDVWARMHSLRHSAGTRLYADTGDLEETARHLVHTKRGTTRIYVHIEENSCRSGNVHLPICRATGVSTSPGNAFTLPTA